MGYLRVLLWTTLFLFFTFSFTVFFEHGFSVAQFPSHARKEWATLQKLYWAKLERAKEDTSRLGR
jgi:hypothetical protein